MKRTFDPHGIFNPGKIVDAPPLTANLRYGAGYTTPNPPTVLRLRASTAAWARAVEMCSGLGACRKTLDGTMCPSYMATREEKHSTRGRANVLRLAMAGRLGEAGLGDEGVHEVLDLCLECRACKAECPVGVDVARFKSEFLADYWRRHGTPLRARAIGHIHRLSRGPAASRRFNAVAAQRARPLAERAAARHRSPPHAAAWVRDTFEQSVRATARRQSPAPEPRAVCSSTRSPIITSRDRDGRGAC